jgi:hypothetical protein
VTGAPTIDALRWSPLFVMNLVVDYDDATHVRGAPSGDRSRYPVTGGAVEGDRVNGTVAGGMDWVRIRPDGVFLIDVRLTLITDDDAPIAVEYAGMTRGDAEPMGRFLRREAYEFHEVYSRVSVRFDTGDKRYSWLNRMLAVANGMRTTGYGPVYHVFAID